MNRKHVRVLALVVGAVVLTLVAAALLRWFDARQMEPQKHYLLAKEYLKQGDRDKAISELKAAIQIDPEFVEAHHEYLANKRSTPKGIVEEYQTYVKQHPQSAALHYLLGRAYAKAGQTNDSTAEYQKSMELSPGFSWTLLQEGLDALNNDDTAKAGELFEQARAKAVDSATMHATLATRLSSVQRYESAREEALRALQLDPTCFDAYPVLWKAELGVTLASEKAQAEVMQSINNLRIRYPINPRALEAVMKGYRIFFDDEEASSVKKTILAVDPKYFDGSGGARYFVRTADGRQLEFSGPALDQIFEAAELADPKSQIASYQRIEKEIKDEDLKLYVLYQFEAEASVKAGDLENGERLLDMMHKAGLDSRASDTVRSSLADAYVDRNIKLDVALEYAKQSIEVVRRDLARYEGMANAEGAAKYQKERLAKLLDTQGRILLAKGMTAQSLVALEESAKLAELERPALDLGLAYEKLQRTDDAVKMLVLAYSFEGATKQQAKQVLDQIYGAREKTSPLTARLNEAVAHRRQSARSGESTKLQDKSAPGFELASVTGKRVRLSDLQGKVVLLNFWATW